MPEKERKSFSLDGDVVEELDEVGNASKVVNDLLNEYFRGGRDGPIALEVKLQEVERRLNEAMDERDSINRRIERLRRQKQQVEEELERREDERTERVREAAEYVAGKDPDNPAVQNWAEKVGMAPRDLLREVEQLPENHA